MRKASECWSLIIRTYIIQKNFSIADKRNQVEEEVYQVYQVEEEVQKDTIVYNMNLYSKYPLCTFRNQYNIWNVWCFIRAVIEILLTRESFYEHWQIFFIWKNGSIERCTITCKYFYWETFPRAEKFLLLMIEIYKKKLYAWHKKDITYIHSLLYQILKYSVIV